MEDWGWMQHILASLKPNGRAAGVLDTDAASRGSGNANSNRKRTCVGNEVIRIATSAARSACCRVPRSPQKNMQSFRQWGNISLK
jgi:hypothetical protein